MEELRGQVPDESNANASLPSWMTPSFIQNILRDYESDDLLYVTDVSPSEMSSTAGGGYASDIFFVSAKVVRGEKNSETMHFVIKNLPTGGDYQKFLSETSLFSREINMYTTILPKIEELLESASPGTFQPFSPRCYYCQREPTPVLVLEDLTFSGYNVPCRTSGLNYEQFKTFLRKLAQFHAASAVAYSLLDSELKELYRAPYFVESEPARAHWDNCFKGMIRSCANEVALWSEFGDETSKSIHNFAEHVMQKFDEVLWHKDDEFNAIIHSDMWANNMMVRFSESGDDFENIRFIDYQVCHYGSPAIDLMYVMTTCPNADVREMPQKALLEEYYNELERALSLLNYGGKIPRFSDILRSYDMRYTLGFIIAATDLAVVLAEDDFDYNSTIQGETAERNPLYSSRGYKKVMYKLLPIFKSKEII